MNISAKTVVSKMDQQMSMLKALVNETPTKAEKVREQAKVIKMYCELLTDEADEQPTVVTNKPSEAPKQVASVQPVQAVQSTSLTPTQGNEDGNDNLLEF
ncbi:DUF5327 family protein [Desertibacillus haloalkaliphilus]|uniref:DUF5327 family protein n=1 Tax=Desertibacillus haloalkaliphilus TaxID=1328930 RepID=UPI001C2578C3|nr:DUF5327 family protein [Desertibacillus haloalkaliphilus]MBU8905824.1 YwdI family protein [Desertibacillus haloalkaliphilus]